MSVAKLHGNMEKFGLMRFIIVTDIVHAFLSKIHLSVCAFLSKILYQTGMKDLLWDRRHMIDKWRELA